MDAEAAISQAAEGLQERGPMGPQPPQQQVDGGESDRKHSSGSSRDRERGSRDRSREREGRSDRHHSSRSHSHHRSHSRGEKGERGSERGERKERGSEKGPEEKRKREASPSPPARRRRRKTGWDVAPTGLETGQLLAAPQSGINPHQSRQSRRLYIGNLPPDITDLSLAEFFNKAMVEAGVVKDNNTTPVIAVQMNKEKNFAFVEFGCVEDASAGMGFDNINLGGSQLKVKRPKDYRVDGEAAASSGQILMLTNGPTEDGPNKIFIGGLPFHLSEDQVKELVSAFGALKMLNLVRESSTGNSKGFAFFEYIDGDVTDRACAALNGMKLGEKTLLVQRANVGPKSQMPHPVNTESCLHNPTAINFFNLGMPIAAAAALLNIDINDPGAPTCILMLLNMVSHADLESDVEYEALMEDVKLESAKYGEVLSVYIPRPLTRGRDQDGNLLPIIEPAWGVGRVYVEFRKPEEAARAQREIGGRRYMGRTVITGYLPEDRYIRKDFAPDPAEEKAYYEKFREEQLEKERKRAMESEYESD